MNPDECINLQPPEGLGLEAKQEAAVRIIPDTQQGGSSRKFDQKILRVHHNT
jgi:hypothetical protein